MAPAPKASFLYNRSMGEVKALLVSTAGSPSVQTIRIHEIEDRETVVKYTEPDLDASQAKQLDEKGFPYGNVERVEIILKDLKPEWNGTYHVYFHNQYFHNEDSHLEINHWQIKWLRLVEKEKSENPMYGPLLVVKVKEGRKGVDGQKPEVYGDCENDLGNAYTLLMGKLNDCVHEVGTWEP